MVRICKTFTFDAAHFLPGVSAWHKCRRMHGHTYRVDIVLEGRPGPSGMVLDYDDIGARWQPINDLLDHRLLNDVRGLENPTTEVLAPFIFYALKGDIPQLVQVRVQESSSTWCEYPVR